MTKFSGYAQKHGEKTFHLAAYIVIAILCLWNIGLQNIAPSMDHVNYWGVAAHLAGYDWSDIMAVGQYQTFGYSLLLVPLYLLFRIGVGTAALLKIAVMLNGVMLAMSYRLAYYTVNRLLPSKQPTPLHKYYLRTACLVTVLYTSNVYMVHLAWTENLLYLMFWCMTVCIANVAEKPNTKSIILLVAVCTYTFSVHNRMIGAVAAAIFVLVLKLAAGRKNLGINKKQLALILSVSAATVFIALLARQYTIHVIYGNNPRTSNNDFAGQASKIMELFSLSGIYEYWIDIMGKLYYLGVASCVLVFVGFFVMVRQLGMALQLKKTRSANKGGQPVKAPALSPTDYTMLFLILSFVAQIMIAALFPGRSLDGTIYGRYSDSAAGPFLLAGFAILPQAHKYGRELLASLFALFLSALFVQQRFDRLVFDGSPESMFSVRPQMTAGISYFFPDGIVSDIFFPVMAAVAILATLLSVNLLNLGQKRKLSLAIAALFLVGCFWAVFGTKGAEGYLTDADRSTRQKTCGSVAQLLKNTEKTTTLYYVLRNENEIPEDVRYLQWLLPDRTVRVISMDEFSAGDFEDESVFLCRGNNANTIAAISDASRLVYNSGGLGVFTRDQSAAASAIAAALPEAWRSANPQVVELDLNDTLTSLSYIKHSYFDRRGFLNFNYDKNEGYITWDTGAVLSDGAYEFVVEMQVFGYGGAGEIGCITVEGYHENENYTRVLTKDDFGLSGKGKIALPVEVMNWREPKIGVYTYGTPAMKITGINYRQMQGNATIKSRDAEALREMGGVVAALVGKGSSYPVCYVDSDSSALPGFPDFSEVNSYFPSGIEECLPGNIVPAKKNRGGRYIILESTGDNAALLALLDEYVVVWRNESYTLLVPDSPQMRQTAGDCGLEILASGDAPVDMRFFYPANEWDSGYDSMPEISLPRGSYEVHVRLGAAAVAGAEVATLNIKGREYPITANMMVGSEYSGVFRLELTEPVNEVGLGLLAHRAAFVTDEWVGIKRVGAGYIFLLPLALSDFEIVNAACYQDGIVTDADGESVITSPVFELNYVERSPYIITIEGEWESDGNMPRIEILRNGELHESLYMGDSGEFAYDFYEWEDSAEWQFRIVADGGLRLDEAKVVRAGG
ncbi:MAG: hypothetical protein LBI54_04725 [Lachnospiraceae bacterium]|nr:hypothetical protein [Lachnospiraceae bacterium]